MRKFVAILMTITMTAGILTGCGSTKEQSSSTSDESSSASESAIDLSDVKLMNDGVLTVGAEVGYPPFEDFKED
ncbi:MAG: ABC transporter substrate-binding protein, partial [Eubacteriales bacterium]|nr:ABC transporter substrate-binding protein [Eubacteriales bacterium]